MFLHRPDPDPPVSFAHTHLHLNLMEIVGRPKPSGHGRGGIWWPNRSGNNLDVQHPTSTSITNGFPLPSSHPPMMAASLALCSMKPGHYWDGTSISEWYVVPFFVRLPVDDWSRGAVVLKKCASVPDVCGCFPLCTCSSVRFSSAFIETDRDTRTRSIRQPFARCKNVYTP